LKRSRLRPISAKRAKRYAAARRLNAALKRRSGGRCELAVSPDCRGRFEHAHHVLSQAQGGKDTMENCMASCDPCNDWVVDHPTEAARLGLHKFRAKEIGVKP
jgi:5-methylcytosine-specific restriction endonuclease McrA